MKRELLLIEHGQTPLDRKGLVHGNLDPGLSPKGRAQAHSLGLRISRMANPPTELVSSPRKRAVQTTRIVSEASGVPSRVAPELAPLDVGDFSGQPERRVAEALRPFFARPSRTIPGGESVAAWRARHQEFAGRLAALAAKKRSRPALVTHSNVIGSLLARATGGADGRTAMAHPPKSASITVVKFPAQGGAK